MRRFHTGAALLVALVTALLAPVPRARADLALNEKSLESAGEALVWTQSNLNQILGTSASNSLTFSGTFTSAGWNMTVNGTYIGVPVSLNFTDTYDAPSNTENFASSGSLGTSTWQGTGSVAYTDVDPATTTFTGGDDVTVTAIAGKKSRVRHVNVMKTNTRTDEGTTTTIDDTGTYDVEKDGVIVQKGVKQTSHIAYDRAQAQNGSLHFQSNDAVVIGQANFTLGTFSGTVQAVPEPPPMALGSVVGAVLAVWLAAGRPGQVQGASALGRPRSASEREPGHAPRAGGRAAVGPDG